MTIQHIQTIELGSSQANITFNSIPQDYDDIFYVISCRSDQAGAYDNSNTLINGSAGSILRLQGNGSSASASSGSAFTMQWPASGATSNTFGNIKFYIANYTASGTAKSVSVDMVTENNAISAIIQILAGLTTSTAPVTTIAIDAPGGSGNFVAGSVASLYGVTAGGDGTVTTS